MRNSIYIRFSMYARKEKIPVCTEAALRVKFRLIGLKETGVVRIWGQPQSYSSLVLMTKINRCARRSIPSCVLATPVARIRKFCSSFLMTSQVKAVANKAIPQLKDLTSYVRNLSKNPPKMEDLSRVPPYVDRKLQVNGFYNFCFQYTTPNPGLVKGVESV